jgi:predicted RNase H-like HicB family nuclease
MRYVVLFEKGANGYSAYAPDLPGCIAAARTLKQTAKLMREAIEFHIEGLRLHGESVPQPTTVAESVLVSA